jgi:hypothetical protein
VKWRGVVKIGGKRVATKMFGTGLGQKRAAAQWEIETREQILNQSTLTDSPDVLQWANRYMSYAEQKHTRQTFKEKQTVFKMFFSFTQETRLDRITPYMVMDYLQM